MNPPFRIAFALGLATAAAVRWFSIGAYRFAHQRLDWNVLRTGVSSILSWEQAFALKPDGILGIVEPWYQVTAEQAGESKVVILNAAVRSHPFHTVTSDDEASGRLAAEHLLNRRLERFAFVGLDGYHFSELRKRGFLQRLRAAKRRGAVPAIDLNSYRDQPEALQNWLRGLEHPCGILCANDGFAADIVTAAREAQISVPDDLAVIGISDDNLGCLESPVTLSSVHEDFAEVGYRAAAHLDDLLRGHATSSSRILIPPGEVVERQSTQAFAVADPLVRRALLLIHQDDGRLMTVDRLLLSLGNVSRRLLEMHFRKTLGRSPYQEILHTRIFRARIILRRSQMPISEVALRCGFYDAPQFCRHFRRIAGETPAKYRKHEKRAVTGLTAAKLNSFGTDEIF